MILIVLRLTDKANLTGLLTAALLLAYLGEKSVAGRSGHRSFARACFGLALVAYLGRWCVGSTAHPDDILEVAVRGVALGLIVFAVVSLLSPIIAAAFDRTIGNLARLIVRIVRTAIRNVWLLIAWCVQLLPSPARWRKERERRRQLEGLAAQSALTHQTAQADQRRREDAKFRCELVFASFGPELKDRFPREQFDDFVRKFMRDDQPPETVERNGDQLNQLMKIHHSKVEPVKWSLDSIAHWFEDTRRSIENLSVPEPFKKSQLAVLNARFAEMMRRHLQENQP